MYPFIPSKYQDLFVPRLCSRLEADEEPLPFNVQNLQNVSSQDGATVGPWPCETQLRWGSVGFMVGIGHEMIWG